MELKPNRLDPIASELDDETADSSLVAAGPFPDEPGRQQGFRDKFIPPLRDELARLTRQLEVLERNAEVIRTEAQQVERALNALSGSEDVGLSQSGKKRKRTVTNEYVRSAVRDLLAEESPLHQDEIKTRVMSKLADFNRRGIQARLDEVLKDCKKTEAGYELADG